MEGQKQHVFTKTVFLRMASKQKLEVKTERHRVSRVEIQRNTCLLTLPGHSWSQVKIFQICQVMVKLWSEVHVTYGDILTQVGHVAYQ